MYMLQNFRIISMVIGNVLVNVKYKILLIVGIKKRKRERKKKGKNPPASRLHFGSQKINKIWYVRDENHMDKRPKISLFEACVIPVRKAFPIYLKAVYLSALHLKSPYYHLYVTWYHKTNTKTENWFLRFFYDILLSMHPLYLCN